ncbi:SET1A methyltransferase, partial [Bucco capensis]|nr:SET1A methyltransferase [Bucco capensis]
EDLHFLRLTYQRLLQEDTGTHWLNDTHWVHHTDILWGARCWGGIGVKEWALGSRSVFWGAAVVWGTAGVFWGACGVFWGACGAIHVCPCCAQLGPNRVLSERRSEQRRLLSAMGSAALADSELLKLNQLK